ncbi:Uncharacterized protein Rs2_36295 [Raphanus sativus]|nr:Uncharacterized protein Rs2_36295 [Raphanus sativus]
MNSLSFTDQQEFGEIQIAFQGGRGREESRYQTRRLQGRSPSADSSGHRLRYSLQVDRLVMAVVVSTWFTTVLGQGNQSQLREQKRKAEVLMERRTSGGVTSAP